MQGSSSSDDDDDNNNNSGKEFPVRQRNSVSFAHEGDSVFPPSV